MKGIRIFGGNGDYRSVQVRGWIEVLGFWGRNGGGSSGSFIRALKMCIPFYQSSYDVEMLYRGKSGLTRLGMPPWASQTAGTSLWDSRPQSSERIAMVLRRMIG
jgi:hypothetical protein